MGGKILLIIIIIIALGIGLYLYHSGAFVNGLKKFNSLISPSSTSSFFSLGSSTIAQGPSTPIGPPPLQQQPTTGGTPPSATTTINPADIPAGYTAAQLSPYFHEVRLGGVSAGTFYYYGTITLDTSFNQNATGTIDISGWQIKSNDGGEYIPQAIDVYDPSGLTAPSDILMKNGDTVYLYSSTAPFNLRLNECIGYIGNVANFSPPLPLTCPYVDQSQIQNFTGACQDYILSLGQCQAPNMSSPQIPPTDYACQDYLENNFNYKSCFNAHAGDANFLSNQVWVWTGSNVVDQDHDTVKLLDRNGLLVDLYTY
ncbi:MAG TPA: hypothetical protein VMR99_01835 [Candidatus Paceibacterota bacterium]|nr:hypothetical protein [Candidatus Paceibacterota bacterium]